METHATASFALIANANKCTIATCCGVDFPPAARASFNAKGLEILLPGGILELTGLFADQVGDVREVLVGDTDKTGAFRNSCTLLFPPFRD